HTFPWSKINCRVVMGNRDRARVTLQIVRFSSVDGNLLDAKAILFRHHVVEPTPVRGPCCSYRSRRHPLASLPAAIGIYQPLRRDPTAELYVHDPVPHRRLPDGYADGHRRVALMCNLAGIGAIDSCYPNIDVPTAIG